MPELAAPLLSVIVPLQTTDDAGALRRVHQILQPGGRVVSILVV